MTKNKSYNITLLCNLRGIDKDSEEAEHMKTWSVLQLLTAIDEERKRVNNTPPVEDDSFTKRAGCEY